MSARPRSTRAGSLTKDSEDPSFRVPALSLEGLEVVLSAPKAPDSAELEARLGLLRNAVARTREVRRGQVLSGVEDVLVDLIGYEDGQVLPFATSRDLWLGEATDRLAPGIRQNLKGVRVGDSKFVNVRFPADHPEEELADRAVSFWVLAKEACVRDVPAADDPAFLKEFGGDREAVLENLMEIAFEEQEEELEEQARERVLDLLIDRARPRIRAAAIEEKIREMWSEREGSLLAERGVSEPDRVACLEAWVTRPSLRQSAARLLAGEVVLRAVAREHGLADGKSRLEPHELYKRAIDFVLAHAEVRFEGDLDELDVSDLTPPRGSRVESHVRERRADDPDVSAATNPRASKVRRT